MEDMTLRIADIKTKSDIEKVKYDFISKITFSNKSDCLLEVKNHEKLLQEEKSTTEVSPQELEERVSAFNEEKSYLFDFELNVGQMTNVRKLESIFQVPSFVVDEAEELIYPLMVRLCYIIVDLTLEGGEIKEGFHLPPVIDFVQYMDEDDDGDSIPQIFKVKEYNDYGEILLLGINRKIKSTHDKKYSLDRDSFESSEFNYQLKHSSEKGNIFNDLTITHKFGRYKASITVESDGYQDEKEARDQLARWLQSLGRGLEIAKVVTV